MQNTQPWKCGESPSPSTIGLTRHLPGADDLHAARASCEQEGTKSVCTSCAQTLLHRPLPSAAEQSQLLEVPFLSCILSYNTSLHGWRAYGSFPLKSWRLNTLLQVLGSGSFFSRTHPPARVLLTPPTWGEAMATPLFVKQSSWGQKGKEWDGRASSVLGVVHGRVTLLTYTATLWNLSIFCCASSAGCSAALTNNAVQGSCPALRGSCLFSNGL